MTSSLEKKLTSLVAKAQQWLKAYATLPPALQAEKKQEMEQLQQLVTAHQALLGEGKSNPSDPTAMDNTAIAYTERLLQLKELLAAS